MSDMITCNLLQACEWIALGWEPMSEEEEFCIGRLRPEKPFLDEDLVDKQVMVAWKRYEDQINEAAAKIKKLLQTGKMRVKGTLGIRKWLAMDLADGKISEEEMQTKLAHHYKYPGARLLVPIMPIISIDPFNEEQLQFLCHDITGNDGIVVYDNLEFSFDALKKMFPKNAQSTKKRLQTMGYTTPYIEIMLEVIEEEKISNENQGKHDILKDIILNKMHAHKVPVSDHIANVLATAIRLPSSQKGGVNPVKK